MVRFVGSLKLAFARRGIESCLIGIALSMIVFVAVVHKIILHVGIRVVGVNTLGSSRIETKLVF
jgi:hypothetical protein